MAFEAIAYGADANVLLVIDESAQGPALLAYDAQTEGPKWQLAFDEPLLSVVFAHPQALPTSGAGSPWREAAPTHVAIVVDAAGALHAVDLHLGKKLGSVGPFGKPRAVASCMTTGALAMAVLDKVLLWRSGHVVETAISRASALAFSADGKTLAVGTEAGDVIMLSLYGGAAAGPENVQPEAPADTLARAFEAHGVGAVADLAQHPNGEWLSAGAYGVFAITEKGAQRHEKIGAGALRARFDGAGARLAVQRSERAIAIYAWPALSVIARVEYTERPVRGMSFGPGDWLGVALDHGDGNKIDVVTSETHRTDTVPGRTHRSWTLYVEGQSKLLSAKEAEDIRRMKSPFTPDAPRKGNGGRIGIGAGLSLALLGLRLCAHASAPSYSSYSTPYTLPTATPTCDRACVSERLAEVEKDCTENSSLGCANDAAAARKALTAGRCPDMTSAIKRMSGAETRASGSGSSTPLFGVHRLLAELGADEACKNGKIRPPPAVTHAQIVRFGKNGKERTIEAIPEATASRDRGESPRALLTTSDGVVLAATLSADTPQRAVVYKRASDGVWPVSFMTAVPSGDVTLVARSSSDVYLVSGTKLAHFDGTSWTDVALPANASIGTAVMAGGDLLMASNEPLDGSAIYRRHVGAWTKETTPAGLSSLAVYGAGASVWAVADDADSNSVLLRRGANAAWTPKTPHLGDRSLELQSLWSSPSGETFIGTQGTVIRTKDSGGTWTETPRPETVGSLWGRSSTDVWAIEGGSTLVHYDGKTWSTVDHDVRGAEYLTGTATDVLVLRSATRKPSTPSDDDDR